MKILGLVAILVPSIALAVISCSDGNSTNANNKELIEIATQHICKAFPEWKDETSREAIVTDLGTEFEVTWALPAGVRVGGAPVVIIDKKTKKVIRAYHEQ